MYSIDSELLLLPFPSANEIYLEHLKLVETQPMRTRERCGKYSALLYSYLGPPLEYKDAHIAVGVYVKAIQSGIVLWFYIDVKVQKSSVSSQIDVSDPPLMSCFLTKKQFKPEH